MDIDPPLFKKKKSRSSRLRESNQPEEDASPDNLATEDSPMTLAATLKKQHKAKASKPRLSFGVEEEVSHMRHGGDQELIGLVDRMARMEGPSKCGRAS